MKLGKKNLIYSFVLAIIIFVAFFSYLTFLFPSLYVEYKIQRSKKQVKDMHYQLLKNDEIKYDIENQIGFHSHIIVDDNFSVINVLSENFSIKFNLENSEIRNKILDIKNIFKDFDLNNNEEVNSKILDKLNKKVKNINLFDQKVFENSNIKVEVKNFVQEENLYSSIMFQRIDRENLLIELTSREENVAEFKMYIIANHTNNKYNITITSVLVPQISDILPVVFSSFPMILLVTILIVLSMSLWYSRDLIKRIINIQKYTEKVKINKSVDTKGLDVNGNDELSLLSKNVVLMNKRLKESYEELEKESIRKDVFMKASSHNLKTPLSAAILLSESMINNIGKYSNREKYLPILKEKINDINNIVIKILELNKFENQELELEKVNINTVFKSIIKKFDIDIANKNLSINIDGSIDWITNFEILENIIFNLMSNCIYYTDKDGLIDVNINENYFQIFNKKSNIPSDIIDSIKDPFISSTSSSSKGLGLYISNYYAELLDMNLQIFNYNDGVKTILKRR